MIKDITIGQFFPGNSVIHKLDPRIKLVLTFVYIVIVFLCKNFVSLASIVVALTVVILLSKISPKLIWKSVKPIFIIIAITSLLQIFYNKDGTVLFTIGKFSLYTGGLYMAIFTTVRIICLVIASSMLTYTTSPTMLTDAMERLFSPLKVIKINVHSIAMMMTIALRFIPTLLEETDKIIKAQKSRGADFMTGNILKRVKAFMPILIPLFISAFRRADDLAMAMEARCYHGGVGRTRLKQLSFASRDYIAMTAFIGILLILTVIKIVFPHMVLFTL